MKTEAKILLDSMINDTRVTTFELVMPRIIHAEFLRHRVFSLNASSSRATPFNKILKSVTFRPSIWRMNGKGMQPKANAGFIRSLIASLAWETARLIAMGFSFFFNRVLKIHKELSNRLLEPFQYTKVVVTATEWQNFFNLRTHPDAQLEIRELAVLMAGALEQSQPVERVIHLPYVTPNELGTAFVESRKGNLKNFWEVIMSSVARCARTSYLNFDGTVDVAKDVELFKKLVGSVPAHRSPTEHQVFHTPFAFELLIDLNDFVENSEDLHGNLSPKVVQFRKLMERKQFNFLFRYAQMK